MLQQMTRTAIVAQEASRPSDAGLYLTLAANGAPGWTSDPSVATAFPSMREAMRASLRLPPALRTVALPRDIECDLQGRPH
jgi:hypothetical protein